MSSTLIPEVLLLLGLLQLKHLLADFVLQNAYILDNRKRYGHPGGLLHVAIHVAGSVLAFAPLPGAASTIALIVAVEGVIHYHLDWAKDNYVAWRNLTPRDAAYWHATGTDQFLHQLTYLAMAGYWGLILSG